MGDKRQGMANSLFFCFLPLLLLQLQLIPKGFYRRGAEREEVAEEE